MRQAHLTVPRDMELQGYSSSSTWPPPYSVSVVPVSSRTVEPRHVLGISVLNRYAAARGASRYSPGTRYHAPTASVLRSVDTGCYLFRHASSVQRLPAHACSLFFSFTEVPRRRIEGGDRKLFGFAHACKCTMSFSPETLVLIAEGNFVHRA